MSKSKELTADIDAIIAETVSYINQRLMSGEDIPYAMFSSASNVHFAAKEAHNSLRGTTMTDILVKATKFSNVLTSEIHKLIETRVNEYLNDVYKGILEGVKDE